MNVGVHVVNARPWATADSIVSLGTRVLALPYRQPLVVAKQWATLDAFSGGRTILGVGAGFMREQFEALGMDTFDRQGEATDEAIRLLRAVWAQGAEVSFTGDVYRFQPVGSCRRRDQAAAAAGQLRAPVRRGWQPHVLHCQVRGCLSTCC